MVLLPAEPSEQRSEQSEEPLRFDIGYQRELCAPADVLEAVATGTRIWTRGQGPVDRLAWDD